MSVLFRKLRRDAWHYRGQIASVTLMLACGIALFIALRSMHGYLLDSQEEYYRAQRFAQVFVSLRRAPAWVADRVAALPGVTAVEQRVVADVLLDVPGAAEAVTGRFVSVPDRERSMLNGLVIQRGRYPSSEGSGEVVVSNALARNHRLDVGDSIRALINGRLQSFRIVGLGLSPEFVYEIRGGIDVFPDNRRFGVLWATRSTLAAAFDLEGACNDLAIGLAPGANVQEVIERTDRLLERYGGLGAHARGDQVSHRFLSDEIAETRVTSVMIPFVFLGITAFLLHTVLSRLVDMEREQIALLRAFGFSSARIAVHYLAYATVPAVSGTALGVALGVWFAQRLAGVYARFFQFPFAQFTPDPSVLGTALAVSAAATLVGSMAALRAVLRLPPAEAMHAPSPPAFRRGLASRLGIESHFSPQTRMVLRSLDRRRAKTCLSIVGIALALAMVVVGRYAFDALELLKRIQFFDVDRWDVSVVFDEPRANRVRHEIAGIPGVERVEPFRAVPVRLVLGHLEQTTTILGLESKAALRRVIDAGSRVVAPPEHGLLLTQALAEQLGAHSGSVLTIEILEGDRRVVAAPVAGTVDELVGTSAYMELGALHRLVRGAQQVNGVFLRVAEARRAQVRGELAALPAVSGVAERSAVLASFERTVQESLRISLTTVVGFAVLIASGIVYNSGRLGLAERARELASLRVLGFSRREVASMLLGEQLAIVICAIPLGWLCGYGLCALVNRRAQSETFRLPLFVSSETFVTATLVVLTALAFTAATLRRRVDRLDPVQALKARE